MANEPPPARNEAANKDAPPSMTLMMTDGSRDRPIGRPLAPWVPRCAGRGHVTVRSDDSMIKQVDADQDVDADGTRRCHLIGPGGGG
jgi:hypothetical protein